jgi:malonyl-CoA/methylmalonyl-CoA synthetase
MSETTMLTSNPCDAARRRARRRHRRFCHCPGCRCAWSRSRPAACGNGEIGGVEVKGPNVFKGYWRMPEKTAEEFTTDLWFKTGDVGFRWTTAAD